MWVRPRTDITSGSATVTTPIFATQYSQGEDGGLSGAKAVVDGGDDAQAGQEQGGALSKVCDLSLNCSWCVCTLCTDVAPAREKLAVNNFMLTIT